MTGTEKGAVEDIIIHPTRAGREKKIPDCGVMLVTPAEMQYGRKSVKEDGGREQFMYGSSLAVAAQDRYFVAGPAVGAPVAAMTMEKLIALGAKRIIMYGWCGTIDQTLQVGDVVVGAKPVSGEGTSQYYQTGEAIMPSSQLCRDLRDIVSDAGFCSSSKNVWSTDAPYREERNHLNTLYHRDGVSCVDMEYSALCAVAAFRNVEFAGLFLVSDELYQQNWTPGYVKKEFREKSKRLVDMLLAGNICGGA